MRRKALSSFSASRTLKEARGKHGDQKRHIVYGSFNTLFPMLSPQDVISVLKYWERLSRLHFDLPFQALSEDGYPTIVVFIVRANIA